MNAKKPVKPRWLRDLARFLPIKSQFVLSGNIRDLQAFETQPEIVAAAPLVDCLEAELRATGYADIVLYTPLSGFRQLGGIPGQDVISRLSLTASDGSSPVSPEALSAGLERIVNSPGAPVALILDFASRLINRNEALTPTEHNLFTRALMLAFSARPRPHGDSRQPFFNTVIWIVDKEGDLPDWFLIDNPRVRHIPIPPPDHQTRRALAANLLRSLSGGKDGSQAEVLKAENTLVNQTEGLLLTDMNAIAQLGRSEGLRFDQVADAVRRYKVGVTEDPWRKIDRAKIAGAEEFIHTRVKGQDHAVIHMMDIVKRAVTGVGRSGESGRPRGVAFLAGPTGVGKTELAKTITSLLFGDESAYIRFDMSEFSAEHSDQRLIGAPPGYVGYDVGGELTNAIREKPFSVVLFDEIEKAHPKILDKFLQILDDGVLTSGRGDRVYFSEALILFTSNLGIYSIDASGRRVANVTSADPHESVSTKVRSEIENHFKLVLNRPEILNRIGENIIVFDFIREDIAASILDQIVGSLLDHVSTLGYHVSVSKEAAHSLRELCLSDLTNGGRGIRNQVEAHLTNPLSRALFDAGETNGSFEIVRIVPGTTTSLDIIGTPPTR